VPSLWLTFDDGPDALGTLSLLDLLAELRARATFFPIAPRAAEHPHLIARMLDDGHEVGLHCHEHVRHSERDLAWLADDTTRALETLRSLGAGPALWRTPWGVVAPWTADVAAEHDLRIVGWTVDTHDWRGDPAHKMFERTQPTLRDGAVVLAHDGIGPGARRDTTNETVEFVRLVSAHARRQGLTLEARR
jgi:peptidoglycan/xylan/chitin deacetylase (PgdA/CDA1 family)